MDQNFDELADRFEHRIYGGIKGRIRLAVLRRDLQRFLHSAAPIGPLAVLDVGAGLSQLSLALAAEEHEVTINDLSETMLAVARSRAKAQGLEQRIHWRLGAFQNLASGAEYDLVLCHAVLEWLADPHKAVASLANLVRPGGVLSLAFYNREAQVFRNLLRGNFKRVRSGVVSGHPGGLTPLCPLSVAEVERWLCEQGFVIEWRSGVRVFHDYVTTASGGNMEESEILDMELEYSHQEPFWRMGRYIHFMCRRHGKSAQ